MKHKSLSRSKLQQVKVMDFKALHKKHQQLLFRR